METQKKHWIKANRQERAVFDVTPASAGWQYLSFQVIALEQGQSYSLPTGDNEMALVPLAGSARLRAGDLTGEVSRKDVFDELPSVLYAPPRTTIEVEALSHFEFSLGGAPAEGKYPVRLFTPAEMKVEIRGGGAAIRQVHHILAFPLPAERLILYEVYVPSGGWSGWPPHCHDGYLGSSYLEEVYYFRLNPRDGLAFHRNYRVDEDFDEFFPVEDTDLVLVTKGFHSTTSAPGSNLYFLNYLAGDLRDEARGTPSVDDPRYAWIRGNWTANTMQLPIMGK